MSTLLLSQSGDHSQDILSGIDVIQFEDASHGIKAKFASTQFNDVQISTHVSIVGGSGANVLTVEGTAIDASGWTFSNWDKFKDSVDLIGTASADTIVGSDQGDSINGLTGDDIVNGGGGGDFISDTGGDDNLSGGDGDDRIFDNGGSDTLSGGDGDDVIGSTGAGADTVDGGAGRDVVQVDRVGSAISYVIDVRSGAGNADIGDGTSIANAEQLAFNGGSGDDLIFGGQFDDTLLGGDGTDTLSGGARDDVIFGGAGNDAIDGGSGNDRLYVLDADGTDHIGGGSGTDFLYMERTSRSQALTLVADGSPAVRDLGDGTLYSGIEQIEFHGGSGADLAVGGDLNDTEHGAGGNDVLIGNGAFDSLYGEEGGDKVMPGPGDDFCIGGDGADTISYEDIATGVNVDLRLTFDQPTGAGNDFIIGFENFTGGAGNDSGIGNGDGNVLSGLGGGDLLNGMGGADTLIGGGGDDGLRGGSGDDRIEGDGGMDTMKGGLGADTFVFAAAADSGPATGLDRVTDFLHGTDKIDLSQIADGLQFIGSDDFSGAGQVRFTGKPAATIVEADLDGDGKADFRLTLNGHMTLDAGDFVL